VALTKVRPAGITTGIGTKEIVTLSGSETGITGITTTWEYLNFKVIDLSSADSSTLRVQLGNSSGYVTSGYEVDSTYINNNSGGAYGAGGFADTGGFSIGNWGASTVHNLVGNFNKEKDTNQVAGYIFDSLAGGTYQGIQFVSGKVTIANIDRIRVISSDGNFDGGKLSITYF
tara:strand:- start:58 stop:576 length:519 start_codon:yes stop_codon:yes gene_type:complete